MIACLCGGIIEVGAIGLIGVTMVIVNLAVGRYNRHQQCKCAKPVYRYDRADRWKEQIVKIQKGGQNTGPVGPRPTTPPTGWGGNFSK